MTGALEQLQIRQNNAQIGVAKKEVSIAQDLRSKKTAKMDILKRKDHKDKIPAFIKSDAGQKELTEYAIDNAKDRTADAIRSHLASIERVNRSTAELQARVNSGESGNTKLFSHNGINYNGNKTINEVLTTNKTFLEGQSGYLQKKVDKFEDDFSKSLVTSVISVQKEIDNLDKEIDGLNTTIGVKGEEINQLQNVNQQRVDKIDDGSYNKLTDGDTLFDDDYGKVGNCDDGTAKEVKGLFGDEFSENLNQFGGTIGLLAGVAGKDEATAKVMTVVAKLQMANALMQRVNLMMEQKGKGLGAMFSAFIGGGARQGGIMSKHGRSYSDGGVASGPTAGYPAVLHGREAVVPLPNGRSIPVDMGAGAGGTNNVSINVNMAEGTTETVSDREEAKALGVAINQAVYQVLEKEQRQGGLLGA